ncbi:MAG: hypothetical protein IJK84_02470 [Bacteroidales bacterium]|nr:hypothetical protein [Bacteroidales bacterium]
MQRYQQKKTPQKKSGESAYRGHFMQNNVVKGTFEARQSSAKIQNSPLKNDFLPLFGQFHCFFSKSRIIAIGVLHRFFILT